MKLLHVDSSITGATSVSRRLSAAIVERCRALMPDLTICRRDLAQDPLRAFSEQHLGARSGLATANDAGDVPEDEVLSELLACDLVVLGAPMYNLTIPTQLKTWIDHITIAGKTFRYSPEGAVGLLGDKAIIIASSRGGIYAAGSPQEGLDHQETYLRAVFTFLGVKDIEVVRAEGVRISADLAETAVNDALTAIAALDSGKLGARAPSTERRQG